MRGYKQKDLLEISRTFSYPRSSSLFLKIMHTSECIGLYYGKRSMVREEERPLVNDHPHNRLTEWTSL